MITSSRKPFLPCLVVPECQAPLIDLDQSLLVLSSVCEYTLISLITSLMSALILSLAPAPQTGSFVKAQSGSLLCPKYYPAQGYRRGICEWLLNKRIREEEIEGRGMHGPEDTAVNKDMVLSS